MKLKLAYTKVHFNCMPAIDLEEYMMDDTSFREMCETIRPSLDIFVVATYSHEKEQLPKGNELRLATRQLIVDRKSTRLNSSH